MSRILVIDDEPAVRSLISRILTREGHEVTEAADGITGMAAFQAGNFQLVITDINMPEMDGIEVIAALREQDVPVVAVSGGGRLGKEVLLDSAHVMGAVHSLEKPFTVEDLLAVARQALGEGGRP